MSELKKLKSIKTKPQFARLLGFKPSTFTYYLYIVKREDQYFKFSIPKKGGGERIINAPTETLKSIQSSLSNLLLNCLDEINKDKFPDSELVEETTKNSNVLKIKCHNTIVKQPSLSHGFERKRSIITNAMMHLDRKNVFNVDLENFFGSFNFGRVRGFFIKNHNFLLNPDIATVIAKIACHNNELPQGSPCSPVISNLITHSLDIKLAKLAEKNSSVYTRYADDITFSSRERTLPKAIARENNGELLIGKNLREEIRRSGFKINEKKTRNQYKNSRQDVTGLIVNKKPNTKKEYWRKVRAQCDSLFKTGTFTEHLDGKPVEGNISSLEGKLNFIDHVDNYNRLRQGPPLNPKYQPKKEAIKNGRAKLRRYLHSGREGTFSKFLFYKFFYAGDLPTILTEGKTDNIYLKAAVHMLANSYPQLASEKTADSPYRLMLRFFEYSKRTRYLLELFGGADYLKDFVMSYKTHYDYYRAPKSTNPVIILLDNDSGSKELISYLSRIKGIFISTTSSSKEVRSSDFVYIFRNLYLVLTPKGEKGEDTDIEYFFSNEDRLRKYRGKCFNTVLKRDEKVDLSKDSFAKHIVHARKKNIDFSRFEKIFDRLVKVLNHYDSIR